MNGEIACAICCETRRDVIAAPRLRMHCWCVELEDIDAIGDAAEIADAGQDIDDHWLERADRAYDDAREAGR